MIPYVRFSHVVNPECLEENKHRFVSLNDDWKINVIFDSRFDGHVLFIWISTE